MWTEIDISCPAKSKRNVLMQVGLCIREIESKNKLLGWHFFLNEPFGDIVVRVETPDPTENEPALDVVSIFESLIRENFTWIKTGKYVPEEKEYDIAWNEVKKYFQVCSELGLLMARGIGENSNCGPLFSPSKLVHTALNQWGYDYPNEAKFYEIKAESTRFLAFLEKNDNLDWYHQVSKIFGSPKFKEIERWK